MNIYQINAIKINEVELNPSGSDSGKEWIELYSDIEINLTNWKIKNNDDQEINLTQSFQNYLIIELPGQWLDNSDEKVFLYNGEELIDETIILEDSSNNDKTWQSCSDWKFDFTTKNSENNCTNNVENNPEDNENTPSDSEPKIYAEIEYDEEDIINGEDFKIEINVFNLKDSDYNFKIWIEGDNNDDYDGKIISDRYGEDSNENDKWLSGNYWIYNLFEGPGDKSKKIEMRIREDYNDFYGDARLFFKLEGEEEDSMYIEVLEDKNKDSDDDDDEDTDSEGADSMREAVLNQIEERKGITGEVINLGSSESYYESEDLKEQNNIIYQSKTELIKKYTIYGFAFLCVILIALLAFDKLN